MASTDRPKQRGSEGGCAAGCGVMSLSDEADVDCEKRSNDTGSEQRGILQGFRRQGSEPPTMMLMGRISVFSRSVVLEV